MQVILCFENLKLGHKLRCTSFGYQVPIKHPFCLFLIKNLGWVNPRSDLLSMGTNSVYDSYPGLWVISLTRIDLKPNLGSRLGTAYVKNRTLKVRFILRIVLILDTCTWFWFFSQVNKTSTRESCYLDTTRKESVGPKLFNFSGYFLHFLVLYTQ